MLKKRKGLLINGFGLSERLISETPVKKPGESGIRKSNHQLAAVAFAVLCPSQRNVMRSAALTCWPYLFQRFLHLKLLSELLDSRLVELVKTFPHHFQIIPVEI